MAQAERYLDFRNGKFAKNEFKAGDFVKFGRIWFHVKETSENPIIVTENENNEINQSNKSLDNTNAEAANIYNATLYPQDQTPRAGQRTGRNLTPNYRNSENSPRSPSFLQPPVVTHGVKTKMSGTSVASNVVHDASESWSNPDEAEEEKEKEVEDKVTFTCRICLCDGDYEEEQSKNRNTNPLVSPCDCSGTWYHLHWFDRLL